MEQAINGSEAIALEHAHHDMQSPSSEETQAHDREQVLADIVPLWMSRADICRTLGISSRTLARLVRAGRVSRLWIDGEPRYRAAQKLLDSDTKAAIDEALDDLEQAERAPFRGAETEANEPAVAAAPEGTYLPALVGLVDQLTERLIFTERALAMAERERDHALSVAGDMAAEARMLMGNFRDISRMVCEANEALSVSNRNSRRLHQLVETLATGISDIAASPWAVMVRSRLEGLLETHG